MVHPTTGSRLRGRTPQTLPEVPAETEREAWKPGPEDVPAPFGLTRLFPGSAEGFAHRWLGDAFRRLFGGSGNLYALDGAFQTLVEQTPLGNAAELLLRSSIYPRSRFSRADEIVELDAARQLLALMVDSGRRAGAVHPRPGAPVSFAATWLTALTLHRVLRDNRTITSREYLPFRRQLQEALQAAEQVLESGVVEETAEDDPPELACLAAVLGTLDANAAVPGPLAILATARLEPTTVAAVVDKADLDRLPVMASFLIPILSLLQLGVPKENRARSALDALILRTPLAHRVTDRIRTTDAAIAYLTDFLLEQQSAAGAFYESPFLTSLFIAAMKPTLPRLPSKVRTQAIKAIRSGQRFVEGSEVSLEALEKKYAILLAAAQEGKTQIEINRELGALRHQIARERLKREYPGDRYAVWDERTLYRRQGGEWIRAIDPDPEDGDPSGRRIDLVLIDLEANRVLRTFEVTSGPGLPTDYRNIPQESLIDGGPAVGADKRDQLEKEHRIRSSYGVYIKVPGEQRYLPLPDQLETVVWRIA